MFALGLLSWLYTRPTSRHRALPHEEVRRAARRSSPANLAALQGGLSTTARRPRTSRSPTRSPPRRCPPGTYRNITGNVALAYGLVAAAHRAELPLVLGSYPITPASDILHTLAGLKRYGVTTMQAEDEIAGIGAALGASFGGAIGVTTTSGPGLALKSETIGLAVSLELPAGHRRRPARRPLDRPAHQDRAVRPAAGDVRPQRRVAGRRSSRRSRPPTASTPPSRRSRIATTYRTPVFLLSDGYLANGSEPWRSRRRRAARPHRRVRHRAQRHRRQGRAGLPPVPARPGDPRPAVGRPRHAGPRAPHRRHREGRRHRQHLLRPRQPRPDDPAARRQDRPASPTASRPRGRRPERRRRGARRSAGARPTARSPPRPQRAQHRRARSPGPTCATSTRSRPTPARCCAPTTGSSCPR